MGRQTGIAWCDYTFNIAWGCHKVSDECKHCYAETWSKRVGLKVWGQDAPRRTFGPKHWADPIVWNRAAVSAGKRARVFCSSMADAFEDHETLEHERQKLWPLIEETPSLDWLLLTKRPENVARMVPWRDWPANVWLGTTVGVRSSFQRLDVVRAIPAAVRFVSFEPLLEDLVGLDLAGIGWAIIGGESGPKARQFYVEHGLRIEDEARRVGAAVFWKQLGQSPVWNGARWRLKDSHGGDWAEWPERLRVRQFPAVAS